MADYAYTNRRYVPQENRYGVEPHRDGYWANPTGFSNNGEPIRDHVCKPVIVDAQGRRRPVVAYGNPDSRSDTIVTKTETIIEQVHVPEVTGHNNGWTRPISPDQPYKVTEFITQVQTEANPYKTSSLSNLNWRKTHNPNVHEGELGHGRNGFNSVHQPYYDGRNEMILEEPMVTGQGGWTRPTQVGWTAPTTLTKPTNDLGAAVEYLKEAAMSQPTQRRFTIPTPVVPRLGNYSSPTTENRDGFRRYGGLGGSEVINTADTYSSVGAIDSREAARRYHGQTY